MKGSLLMPRAISCLLLYVFLEAWGAFVGSAVLLFCLFVVGWQLRFLLTNEHVTQSGVEGRK
jgi:hypothetical protein